MSGDWLSVGEVAALLQVHRKTVKRLVGLPYLRLNPRGDRKYRAADLAAYIEGRMVR